MYLLKSRSKITKLLTKVGSKLFKYFLIYRMETSFENSLLRLGFFDIDFNNIKNTYEVNKAWLEKGPHKIDSVLFFCSSLW